MGLLGGLFGGAFGSALEGIIKGDSNLEDIISGEPKSGGKLGGPFGDGGIVADPSKIITEKIKEKVKKDGGLIGDCVKLADDTKEEFTELMTDGFAEMVIKGNTNYKTSFEIRNEADKIVALQAERYQNKCKELNSVLSNLNEHISDLYKKKIELAKRVNVQVGNKQAISSRVCYQSWMEPTYVETKSNMSMLCNMMGLTNITSIADRKNSAKEYLDDAKDYKVYVSKKIAEMNRIKANVNTIEQSLQEEDKMLEALEKSMDMHRKLEYEKIAKQLENLIVQYILNENGKKNETYLAALNQLESLCENI